MDARLEALFLAPDAGEPMDRRERVEAVEGGLRGDRYQTGQGHYAPLDGCEVTLVSQTALDRIREASEMDLSSGQHRRNLVVSGVAVDDLLGATFGVGDATLRGTRRRPPCAYLESVAEPEGIAAALQERGGICADVVEPGELRVGDAVRIVEPDPRTAGERIAERLARDGTQAGHEDH